jgi:hypothetical protein
MTGAILVESILQALAAGLLIGAIFGLMCVGLALIFGVMRVINFLPTVISDAKLVNGGPAKYYPGGEMKFDAMGRRVGAGLAIIQWQSGVPVTIYPDNLAMTKPIWPKR